MLQMRTFSSSAGFSPPRETGIRLHIFFHSVHYKREPHLAEDRRATSWLDGTFRCTAFVTNHTLDPLLCRREVTDVGWWESFRDCCSRLCCCGGRGGKICHASCFFEAACNVSLRGEAAQGSCPFVFFVVLCNFVLLGVPWHVSEHKTWR